VCKNYPRRAFPSLNRKVGAYGKGIVTLDGTRVTLLQKLRQHPDEESWREFVRLYRPLIMSYAARFGADRHETEDIAQEALGIVARRIGSFERYNHPGSFRAWLRKVTASKVRRLFAVKARRPMTFGGSTGLRLAASWPSPYDNQDAIWNEEWAKRQLQVAMTRAREEVQPKTWRAFEMYVLEGRNAEDTAREMNMRPGMVYVCKSRVLQRIRDISNTLEQEE